MSAGTYCYNSTTGGIDLPDTIIDSPYDICPTNWRMPTGGADGELQDLYSKYDAPITFKNSLSASISGLFFEDEIHNGDAYGYIWSSTYNGPFSMHDLLITRYNTTRPQDNDSRNSGLPGRCIVK